MKAAPMTNRPDFDLMKQTDILLFYHIQIPRWMFYDRRYNHISLDAKVAYGFLLNRFQLSKLNGWMNDKGEIFLVYTRRELSEELGISYRKTIACMKELRDACLVWERRCGRGDANQIYLAHVEHNEEDARKHRSAPFVSPGDEAASGVRRSADYALHEDDDAEECPEPLYPLHGVPELRSADFTLHEIDPRNGDEIFTHLDCNAAPGQEVSNLHIKNCENGTSGVAGLAGQELQKTHPNYTYVNNNYKRDTETSQSASPARAREGPGGQTDDDLDGLESVLRGCDLWTFPQETAKVFENAIERLWFTTSYKIGKAVLPQQKVRSHLHELDNIRLQEAERKIFSNTERVIKNSTAYVMAVIFNTIWELESDVMADPYLNSLRQSPGGGET